MNYFPISVFFNHFLKFIKNTWHIYKLITILIIIILIQILIFLEYSIFTVLLDRFVVIAAPETVLTKTIDIMSVFLTPARTQQLFLALVSLLLVVVIKFSSLSRSPEDAPARCPNGLSSIYF
jgi:hypothetical protein